MTLRRAASSPLAVLAALSVAAGGHGDELPSPPSIQAVHIAGRRPRIDGRIEEDLWAVAPVASGFIQREPRSGALPSEKTEARFLYDDNALYVAIRAFDSDPDAIQGRVTARDVDSESDWVAVELDTFLDHQSGYRFGLNAAGVQLDSQLSADTRVDPSWDAVWEGASVITVEGWTAVFRIPFRCLRFGSQPGWGLNLIRKVARRQELDTWSPILRQQSGWVSRFGLLTGLENLRLPRRLSLRPYALSSVTFPVHGSAGGTGRGGLDFRQAVTANWTIAGAINPDFGQIEADVTVLNLSVFETYYPEKRPLFTEDASFWQTPYQLFFSRRIGRAPAEPALAAGETLISTPAATTILEATRLTGRTEGGLRVGVLQALTGSEHASVALASGALDRRLVESTASYLVARAEQDLGSGSSIGVIATALHRDRARPIFSGGLDWSLLWSNREYGFDGQAAVSRAEPGGQREWGGAVSLSLSKRSGWLQAGVSASGESPRFDIGDMGYIGRSDHLSASAWLALQRTEPWGPLNEAYVNLSGGLGWNWAGLPLRRGFELDGNVGLKNLMQLGGGLSRSLATLDDLDTRGGPLIVSPARWSFWGYLSSNSTRPLTGTVDASMGSSEAGGSSHGLGVSASLQAHDQLSLSLRLGYSRDHDPAQWIENVDDDRDGVLDHFVYGAIHTETVDLQLRVSYAFSPRFTLDWFVQPYIAIGSYSDIKELARGRSFEFRPFAIGYDPDFSDRSLNSNLVLRWEYASGSSLYVVWKESRYDDSDPGRLRLTHDLGRAFRGPATQSLSFKADYRFDVGW